MLIVRISLGVILVFALVIAAYMQLPKFGKYPSGERLKRIKGSPNFRDGAFVNKSHTPILTEGTSFYRVLITFLFEKKERIAPPDTIPSVKTNLLNLDSTQDVLIWFGHSSYFMQIDGKKILVDPVFCGYASPFSFNIKGFPGTDIYTADDLPEIDYLFISHDHWDHLDMETVKKLEPKVKQVICGLGTGEHLAYWGYPEHKIIENDWDETAELAPGFTVHTVTARHASGRGFRAKRALWAAFVLKTPTMNMFIGGDGGYDTHFAEIGRKFGPFDVAILENGQYDVKWKYIHFLPGENLQAAKDLGAKRVFPVHHSKFPLSTHPWDEPMISITEHNKSFRIPLITPMIGEQVNLKDSAQVFSRWWEQVK